MAEVKKPTTYEEQIETLRNHGFIIDDEADCKDKLSFVGYYRLSAYFLPFRQPGGSYSGEVRFDVIYRIYEFDRKLRNLLFSVVEVIEISFRSKLSYFHSAKYGSLGYKSAENFNNKHNHEKFEMNIEREIESNSKVAFVKHHIDNYDGKFPLWVVTAAPSGLELSGQESRRLWGAVLVLRALYPFTDKWNSEFVPSINALFEEYKDDIHLCYIAFPNDWMDKLFK